MLASFSIIPIGVGENLKTYVAEIVKLVQDSGLEYRLGPMETTVEGEPEAVWTLLKKCHDRMRTLSNRVITHIAIDDREGAQNRIRGKVEEIEAILKK